MIQYQTENLVAFRLSSVIMISLLACGCAEEQETAIDFSQATGPLIEMDNAMDTREVDLGKYDITISQRDTNSTLLVDFHVFAELPNYKREAFVEIFETHHHRVRHAIILNLRSFDRARLNEPDLLSVRDSIKEVILANVEEPKIDGIGFYHFRLLEE